jgi:hypothetical protein
MCIETPRRQLMQQGLPDMGARRLDQGDVGEFPTSETPAQLCGQRQTTGSASYDHDSMHVIPF